MVDVSNRKNVSKSFLPKTSIFGVCPLEFGLKYKIAEDIYTNYVTYVKKFVILLKNLYMIFISDIKPYFIKAWRSSLNRALTTTRLQADFYLTSAIECALNWHRWRQKRGIVLSSSDEKRFQSTKSRHFAVKMHRIGAFLRPHLSLVVFLTSFLNTMSNFGRSGPAVAENRPAVPSLSWPG